MTESEDDSKPLVIDKAEFSELMGELRRIARAIAATKIDFQAGTEKNTRYLKVFGFSEQEVADMLGVTRQAVNKALKTRKKSR